MSQENVELTRAPFRRSMTATSTLCWLAFTTTWRPSRASPLLRAGTAPTMGSAAGLRVRGRGAESDTPLDAAIWHVNQFRDGKVIRWRVYTSESEALEAVGLSE
jgi:ketosteroid isomerase-like protein